MRPIFIYALCDPLTNEVRYLGQTEAPDIRLRAHINNWRENWHVSRWIRGLRDKKFRPIMEILDVVPDNEADFWEREYIQNFRECGAILTNLTDGGDGCKGCKRTPEVRAKIRAAKLGTKNPFFGKKHSLTTRANQRAGSLGRKHTPEEQEKMRAWQFGRKHKHNTSGFVGTTRPNNAGKWQAHYQSNRKKVYVGSFLQLEDAVFARALAIAIL